MPGVALTQAQASIASGPQLLPGRCCRTSCRTPSRQHWLKLSPGRPLQGLRPWFNGRSPQSTWAPLRPQRALQTPLEAKLEARFAIFSTIPCCQTSPPHRGSLTKCRTILYSDRNTPQQRRFNLPLRALLNSGSVETIQMQHPPVTPQALLRPAHLSSDQVPALADAK